MNNKTIRKDSVPVVDRTGPDLPDLPDRFGIRFGSVRTFLMKCVPKWYLRLDFTFKSSKVAIFFGQISEISFQSHLIFIIQSFRNFEAGYIWKFICYEVRFGKVRFGSVKITGPVRFGKSGICLVRSTTAILPSWNLNVHSNFDIVNFAI